LGESSKLGNHDEKSETEKPNSEKEKADSGYEDAKSAQFNPIWRHPEPKWEKYANSGN